MGQPRGQPRLKVTKEMIEKAESLAAQGLTMAQIAAVLGMGERTIYEKKIEYPQFAQSIKNGRAKGLATITNALFTNAKSGNTVAQIFYLKNRDPENWEDVQKRQYVGKDNESLYPKHIKITVVSAKKDNNEK